MKAHELRQQLDTAAVEGRTLTAVEAQQIEREIKKVPEAYQGVLTARLNVVRS
ncbi:MAG: hypothetical protein AAFY26_06070 [Cyanobacteria bacterium J06638_22]